MRIGPMYFHTSIFVSQRDKEGLIALPLRDLWTCLLEKQTRYIKRKVKKWFINTPKLKNKRRIVRDGCSGDGCKDGYGGVCNCDVASSHCIVTARCDQHEQTWVPCWTEVLSVSRMWELWAITRKSCTYYQKYLHHHARMLQKFQNITR